jgi:hypothetical protein
MPLLPVVELPDANPQAASNTAKNHESYHLTRQLEPETPTIPIHARGGYLF